MKKSKSKFLQKGDVISLEVGMTVYANIPAKFVYSNKPLDDTKVSHDVKIGKVFGIAANFNKEVGRCIDRVKESVESIGLRVSKSLVKDFVDSLLPEQVDETYDTGKLAGMYVVTGTQNTGGGPAHGNDFYPNGHEVTIKRLKTNGAFNPKGIELKFYQSGAFTAMITDIEPVKHMSIN